MKRRTFLIGSASSLSVLALAACTPTGPLPTPSVTPSPTLVPQPAAMRRTRWSKDPFSLGSFSYAQIGSTPQHRSALAEPVLDRLFFAGEATSVDEPGTVQGARSSGRLAARAVMSAGTANERVAVVGAGIAGITAARLLRDSGYSVVVIEARKRAGGRIETVTDPEWPFPIELGPSFVRSSAENPLDELLAGLGVPTRAFPADPEARNRAGAVIPVRAVGADAVARALDWAAKQAQDVSVERALVDSGEAKLSTTDGADGVSDADWLDYEISTDLEMRSGATVGQMSAWYSPAPDGAAEDRIVLGGYATLVEDASADVGLLLSTLVTRVAYTEEGVSIRLGTGESLTAARVIVTVPLGVLKTDAVEFQPPLPFAHRGAIAALGMGVLDKVWLRFAEPFWTTDAPLWMTVGDDSDFPVWVNMMPLTGEPVLMGLVTAENAVRLAGARDDEFRRAALRSLEPFAARP
jgi:monoamine oxidase